MQHIFIQTTQHCLFLIRLTRYIQLNIMMQLHARLRHTRNQWEPKGLLAANESGPLWAYKSGP
jgi:hypothetical protein